MRTVLRGQSLPPMKRVVVIWISLGLCVVGGVVANFFYFSGCRYVTPTRTYASFEEARQVIEQGWLPGFLPESAYDIREKHDNEKNTVLAAFSFRSANDISLILSQANELPVGMLHKVRPRWICKSEPWFSSAIVRAKSGELIAEGFKMFEWVANHADDNEFIIIKWYLLVNLDAGICYMWN
jgi:hypothetical protein